MKRTQNYEVVVALPSEISNMAINVKKVPKFIFGENFPKKKEILWLTKKVLNTYPTNKKSSYSSYVSIKSDKQHRQIFIKLLKDSNFQNKGRVTS